MKKAETFRVSVNFPKENENEFNRVKKSLNIATNSEMIRFSLGLMLLVTQHIDEGYEMLFQKENKTKTVLMPFSSLTAKVGRVKKE